MGLTTMTSKPSDGADDPYLWLEEIEGKRAVGVVDGNHDNFQFHVHGRTLLARK